MQPEKPARILHGFGSMDCQMHDLRQAGFVLSDCLWKCPLFRSLIAVHCIIQTFAQANVGTVFKTRKLTLGARISRTIPGGSKWLAALRASAH